MRAVAIAADTELASTLRAGLAGVVGDVEVATSSEDLAGDAGIAVVHATTNVTDTVRRCRDRVKSDAPLVVVVPAADSPALITALLASPQVAAVLTAARVTERSIAAIALRLDKGSVFGLERLVPDGVQVHSILVASYKDKLACLDQLERFAQTHKIRGKYRESILQCADEVLMNALYVAPREAARRRRLDTSSAAIAARARRAVVVQWAYAKRTLFLSVRDPYGSLSRDDLVRSWAAAIDSSTHPSEAAGGGLGLEIISHGSTSLGYNQVPDVATECVCSFDTTVPKLQLEEVGFYEETDPEAIAEVKSAVKQATIAPEMHEAAPSRIPWLLIAAALLAAGAVIAALLTR